MICFYHRADLDGKCSGAIIKQKYPKCKMVGVDYGDNLDEMISNCEVDEEVVMVDFCFEPFTYMEELANKCNLTWIDHHKSAIEAYDKSAAEFHGIQEIGVSSAELTWEFSHPGTRMPTSVYYLGRYDVWDWEDRPEPIKEFQLGMGVHDNSPEDRIWDEILVSPRDDLVFGQNNIIDRICNDGEAIIKYLNRGNESIMIEGSFTAELEGLTTLAINTPFRGSEIFISKWDSSKYDAMVVFTRLSDGSWRNSIYSEGNVDVASIAEKMGGGGHKNAAGFRTASLDHLHVLV